MIAATKKLTNKGKVWIVPIANGEGESNRLSGRRTPFCNCKDHEDDGEKCKHIFAVEYATIRRERQTDGTVVETEEP